MKAVVLEKFGGPEVLELKEIDKPVPADNEVMIRVHATSVTSGDCNARGFVFIPPGLTPIARLMLGIRKPKTKILGCEFSGTVEALGKNVKLFKEGDRVFGIDGNNMGAYAEYKCLHENTAIITKPVNINFEDAAVIPAGALTALYFLKVQGKISGGMKVLVNGASGSVGTAAVQIAKYFGAEVTGVCSSANLDLVKSVGADYVIDYTGEDFTRNGKVYDMILDTVVGKTSYNRCRNSLKKNGIYLAVAGGLRELIQMVLTSLAGTFPGREDKSGKVVFGGGTACEKKEYMILIKELVEQGRLKAVIDKRFTLDQIVEAHQYVDHGHKKGNVVITI